MSLSIIIYASSFYQTRVYARIPIFIIITYYNLINIIILCSHVECHAINNNKNE